MNLIPVEFRPLAGASVQTVNARDLHGFLDVQKDFSDWMKAQIERARLIAGQHYTSGVFPKEGENLGGRPRTDYFLSLDAAKHVAMMSGAEKGFEVRDYFIECERRAKDPIHLLNDPSAMRGLLLSYSEKVLALQAQVAEQAPKVEGFDRIAAADGSLCLRDAAKALQVAPMKLNQALQAHRWIYRRVGHGSFVAYQDKLQAGFLTAKISTHLGSDGSDRVAEQVRVTAKGMARLATLVAAGFLGGNQQQAA